jgi:branched-chain amino acid transport system permease protein
VVGGLSFSIYRILLFAIAVLVIAGLWALFRFTSFGLQARATMSNADMARSLGINTTRIYMLTFGLGSFLAGTAGALFALSRRFNEFWGDLYPNRLHRSGGSRQSQYHRRPDACCLDISTGQNGLHNHVNILGGYVAMLAAALLVIRFTPSGVSELIPW